ncbi:MAG: hypothetical protein AAGC71_12410 [Pseudomonadota bacterium]
MAIKIQLDLVLRRLIAEFNNANMIVTREYFHDQLVLLDTHLRLEC